jgi:hypothetical protein
MATQLELLRQAAADLQAALVDPHPSDPAWCVKTDALLADIRGLTGYGDALVFPLRSNDDPNITCLFCGESGCDLAVTYRRTYRTGTTNGIRAVSGAHSQCAVHARLTTKWPMSDCIEERIGLLTRGLQASGEEARGLLDHLLQSIDQREALRKERNALLAAVTANPTPSNNGACVPVSYEWYKAVGDAAEACKADLPPVAPEKSEGTQ